MPNISFDIGGKWDLSITCTKTARSLATNSNLIGKGTLERNNNISQNIVSIPNLLVGPHPHKI